MKKYSSSITLIANSMMKLGFSNANVLPLLRFRLLPLLYSTSTSSSPPSLINDITTKSNCSSFSEFLVDSLGFDINQSKSVSSMLSNRRQQANATKVSDFNFVDNAISVVNFFKQLGFHNSQIKTLIAKEPRYLLSSVDNSLKPKVELLIKELSISNSDLVDVILKNNEILRVKLEPVIDAFRTVLGSDDKVVEYFKRRRSYLGASANLLSNCQVLNDLFGVSMETIRNYVHISPRLFVTKHDLFRKVVVKVEEKLGIPPDSPLFVYGAQLLACYDEKKLENKFEIFKSFGWTQSQIAVLISRNPCCMYSSESMIKKKLDFLMNTVGYTPHFLMTRVSFFTYSLEKRLAPRYRVIQILKEKGKVKASCSLSTVSTLSESAFAKRFVLPFEEVHEVYAQLTGSKVGSLDVGRAKGQS